MTPTLSTRPAGRPRLARLAALAGLLVAAACASADRRHAVPADLETRAVVPGFDEGIRYHPRSAEDLGTFEKDFVDSIDRERVALAIDGHRGALPPTAFLAISGGGDNGAFGAGFLKGWTKAGTRPVFRLVTGVSTGALIAPFAFLGSDYDATLETIYTSISLSDVARERAIWSAFFGDALSDNAPLKKLVEKTITPQVIAAIAAEHAKGRMLLVGTANLDARRPVIWNVTKIAASGNPKALELIRSLLIASSAIPGTFPPVMIDVEVDGVAYQEMHVDGGTVTQVFFYPPGIKLGELSKEAGLERKRTVYVLRNARLDPQWAQVDRRTLPIALRSIATLIQYQGIGDLYRMYTIARRDGVEYQLAYIPPNFQVPHVTDFDTAYMKSLFQFGYELAAAGYEWSHEPPILFSR